MTIHETKTKIQLKCDDKTWEQLKQITPKTKTINQAIIDIIQEHIRTIQKSGKRK